MKTASTLLAYSSLLGENSERVEVDEGRVSRPCWFGTGAAKPDLPVADEDYPQETLNEPVESRWDIRLPQT